MPYRQFALRNYFQWQMPSNRAWDASVLSGKNENPAWALPFGHHPGEMLFDLDADPGEIHDLSGDPGYSAILESMRSALSEHMRLTGDLGFFPPDTRRGKILYDYVHGGDYDLEALLSLAEAASIADVASLPLFEQALGSELPEMRFWGVVGVAVLAVSGAIDSCPDALPALVRDSNPYVAAEAAYALAYLGDAAAAVEALLNPADPADLKISYSALECLSLDPSMREAIRPYVAQLSEAAEKLPRDENEAPGLMARGILANLGEMDVNDIHGPESYEKGLKLNQGRRPMIPRP